MEANIRTADLLTDNRHANSHPSALDVHDYKALYETEKRRCETEKALREQERRTLCTMRQILTTKDVKPTEKMALAWIVLEAATRTPDGNRVVFDDLTEEALAKQLDLSKGTAGAALRALADAHIIERPQTHSEAVDRAGNPLNGRRAFSKALGDWWRKPSLTIMSHPLPSPIPPTSESKRAQQVRERSAHERELAKVAVKLMEIACPDCGAVGKWHLTCGACGSTHVADALAEGEGLVDERVEVTYSHRCDPETSMGETFTHRAHAENPAITNGETAGNMTGETFTHRAHAENPAITNGETAGNMTGETFTHRAHAENPAITNGETAGNTTGETFTHRAHAENLAITNGETAGNMTGETFTHRVGGMITPMGDAERMDPVAPPNAAPATVQNPACIPSMGQNLACQQEGTERGEREVGAVPLCSWISASARIDFQMLTTPRAMSGAETIDWLASSPAFDASFVLVGERGKNPLEVGWQKHPRTKEDALAHLARGGNVGLLCGRKTIDPRITSDDMGSAVGGGAMSSSIARWLLVIDLDSELEEFIAQYPQFAPAPRIYRANAPDKMKLIVFATDECPSTRHFRKADQKTAGPA